MKKWINGLIGAIVGAIAAAIPAMLTDPEHFSPADPGAWKRLVPLLGASGLVGAALYLKQHPTPWDGTERRSGDSQTRAAPNSGVLSPK